MAILMFAVFTIGGGMLGGPVGIIAGIMLWVVIPQLLLS